jgi:mannose-6-phosphate isomerase-like protein (cupin superfamily)
VGDTKVVLRSRESVHVPLGEPRRIGNEEDDDLILVAVQPGAYLGEDDIEGGPGNPTDD